MKTLATFDTQYSADTVESCIVDPEWMACGTYQLLDGEKQEKAGKLYLFKWTESFQPKFTIETNAILDMKWNPLGKELALVDAKGCLGIYNLNDQNFDTIQLSNAIALSLDWNNRIQLATPDISISFSDGQIMIYSFETKEIISQWQAHSNEVWITAYDYHNPNVLYSGSDDCLMKQWDLRSYSQPTKTLKQHSMGVTSIQKHSNDENILFSGSYDEQIRVWDTRNLLRPLFTSEPTGGGIWRLKSHPKQKNLLAAACMHNGFQIFKWNGLQLDLYQHYDKHESLAYGIDWLSDDKLASCSFYDHSLHFWQL